MPFDLIAIGMQRDATVVVGSWDLRSLLCADDVRRDLDFIWSTNGIHKTILLQ